MLIEQHVNALKERVLGVFSGDVEDMSLRMIDASIDVGAVHLLKLSIGPPTPYMAGKALLHTRVLLTEESALSGIQLLGWMRQVGSKMYDMELVTLDEFGIALDIDDDLMEPLEGIRDKHRIMQKYRGKKDSEGAMATVAKHDIFWKAYQKYVMGIEPDEWDMFANTTVGTIMTMMLMDTTNYFYALQTGPPLPRELEQHLDYFERYQLWKKNES
jgi:hypothetical protein